MNSVEVPSRSQIMETIEEKLEPIARCCIPYSAVGAAFMFWVGMMLTKQPFYLLGMEDVESCKNNAFGAMWTFIVTFGLSVAFLVYESSAQQRRANTGFDSVEYHQILPPGMSEYQPNVHVSHHGQDSDDEFDSTLELSNFGAPDSPDDDDDDEIEVRELI